MTLERAIARLVKTINRQVGVDSKHFEVTAPIQDGHVVGWQASAASPAREVGGPLAQADVLLKLIGRLDSRFSGVRYGGLEIRRQGDYLYLKVSRVYRAPVA